MKSRKQKIKQRVIDSLKEKAELNYNKGPFIRNNTLKPNRKKRRHSGRTYPRIIKPTMKYSEIIDNAFEPDWYWDEWIEYRDGARDFTKLDKPNFFWNEKDREICRKKNKKIKKKLEIRKAGKLKRDINNKENSI